VLWGLDLKGFWWRKNKFRLYLIKSLTTTESHILWSRKNVHKYTTSIPTAKAYIEKFLKQRRKSCLNGSVLLVRCKIKRTVVTSWCPDCIVGMSFDACFREFHTQLELWKSGPQE
jgi:hypothetical protein